MARSNRLHLYLPLQTIDTLDKLCAECGVARSEMIRRALEAYMYDLATRAHVANAGARLAPKRNAA